MEIGIPMDGPEKVFLTVKNVLGATITKGYAVALCIAGNSFDGQSAVLADSAGDNLPGFIGIAKADIANTEYGPVQCFGHADSVLISAVGTSITIDQGEIMTPGPLAGSMTSAVLATPLVSGGGFIVCEEDTTVSAASYVGGFIKCL